MNRFSFPSLASLALVVAAFGSGCADVESDVDGEPSAEATTDALGTSVSLLNPSGAYVASISAAGTGCPAGTWKPTISADGKSVSVTFDAFEAVVEPGVAFNVADCLLILDIKTPSGMSFAVRKVHTQGYAKLDQAGMRARETAKVYFQGNPMPAQEQRSSIEGPFDNAIIFDDEVGIVDLVWSPCATNRRLNIQKRVVIQNNRNKTGRGYISIGSGKADLRFDLAWRQC